MKASTIRTYQWLHTWTGLLAGFALFIAFYAGALSIFRADIDVWQTPPWQSDTRQQLSAQQLVERLVRVQPQAADDFGLSVFPADQHRAPYAFWFGQGKYHYLTAEQAATPRSDLPAQQVSDFVYALHYSLGLASPGLYLMGVVSLLYGLAIISGLVIHFPSLLKQLFALRPGRNLKRWWSDAHNVIGVLSLPFHIIFALTGALFCLVGPTLLLLGKLAFDGKLEADYGRAIQPVPSLIVPDQANPAPSLPVPTLLELARRQASRLGADAFQPFYLHYSHYGQARGTVEITANIDRQLSTIGSITLRASDGALVASHAGRTLDINGVANASLYGLHFGNFGGRTVQWLYFLLGLAGAFLFYSGNLLWLESRRKRRHSQQPRKVRFMARATIGVCIGSCLAISMSFLATLVLARAGLSARLGPAPVFWISLGLACLHATWRAVPKAAYELLLLTAIVSVLTGVLDLVCSGPHLLSAWDPAAHAVLTIDLVAVLLGMGFGCMARAMQQRARHGEPHSIWAQS